MRHSTNLCSTTYYVLEAPEVHRCLLVSKGRPAAICTFSHLFLRTCTLAFLEHFYGWRMCTWNILDLVMITFALPEPHGGIVKSMYLPHLHVTSIACTILPCCLTWSDE